MEISYFDKRIQYFQIMPKQPKIKGKKQTSNFDSILPVKLVLGLIVLITIVAYIPVFNAEFTNWDDQGYVTENAKIKELSAENIKSFFTDDFVANYHPLTMLSLALDYSIAGENATFFHIVNLIYHLLNTLLVLYFALLLFQRFKVPHFRDFALIVAALFGVHTLHVESVAWISERKDVMYAMFFLLSLINYLKYLEKKHWKFYVLTIVFFMFSLLSKGQAVSLAVTLILLDFIYSRKLLSIKVILEKIPFLGLAILFGLWAIDAQQSGEAMAESIQENVSFFERLLFASYGYVQYHIKLIVPVNLSAIYPYPPKLNGSFGAYFYIYFVVAIGILMTIIFALRKNKFIAFGMLFFLLNIALVLQIIPVGDAIMADRYSYVPSIGFFILLMGIVAHLIQKKNLNIKLIITVFGAYTLLLTAMTYNRVQVWQNSMSLWNDVISKQENVVVALNNRGTLHYKADRDQKAFNDFSQAIKSSPKNVQAYNNRGSVRSKMQDSQGAIKDYSKAIELKPTFAEAYYGRGSVYLSLNKFEEAILDLNKSIELRPAYPEAFMNRANARLNMGGVNAAMDDFNRSLELNPNNYEAYSNRGIAKVILGDFDGAISDYTEAIILNPKDGLTFYLRGLAYANQIKRELACSDLEQASMLGFSAAKQKMAEICR